LETICLQCLAKAPGDRYRDALALFEDLRRFRIGQRILARRKGPIARIVSWSLLLEVLCHCQIVFFDESREVFGNYAASRNVNWISGVRVDQWFPGTPRLAVVQNPVDAALDIRLSERAPRLGRCRYG
jgi:hypothetical protein